MVGVLALGACGDTYSWDAEMGDNERAQRVESLLAAVDARTSEAVGSRAAEVAATMSDDEIVASAASICRGLHEGRETQAIIDTTSEEVPVFDGVAIGIIGPPAVEFLCPHLDPSAS
jgi:hypothetical protein